MLAAGVSNAENTRQHQTDHQNDEDNNAAEEDWKTLVKCFFKRRLLEEIHFLFFPCDSIIPELVSNSTDCNADQITDQEGKQEQEHDPLTKNKQSSVSYAFNGAQIHDCYSVPFLQ
jgi:hypothetical protein